MEPRKIIANLNITFANPKEFNESKLESLCDFINAAYAKAEKGVWPETKKRIDKDALMQVIESNSLLVAELKEEVVGCMRVSFDNKNENIASFGLFAVPPKLQGQGIGLALVTAFEAHAKKHGRFIFELDILTPRDWTKAPESNKVTLLARYKKNGYVAKQTLNYEQIEEKAYMLLTTCDFTVYQKELPSFQLFHSLKEYVNKCKNNKTQAQASDQRAMLIAEKLMASLKDPESKDNLTHEELSDLQSDELRSIIDSHIDQLPTKFTDLFARKSHYRI